MSLLSRDRCYTGRRISVDLDTIRFPNGSSGTLEMVRHPGAAAVIPFLDPPTAPDPRILLISQYRWAAQGFLWEVPAGTLGPREAPETCALRELREEAGAVAQTLIPLTAVYTTPGFTDELIHLFAATGLRPVKAEPEADEFLEVHAIPWSEVGRMIRRGEIRDGKSLVAIMYAQCFLRASASPGGQA